MSRVYISVGSNIDKESNVPSGLAALRARFGTLCSSTVYESKAFGFEGDNFHNLVVGFDTREDVYRVAAALQTIEEQHGRCRNGQRFFSRTLDLDLLLYGEQIICEPGLMIPRSELVNHAFVLRPLAEIAGEERHPLTGLTYQALWEALDKTGQELWPVSGERDEGRFG